MNPDPGWRRVVATLPRILVPGGTKRTSGEAGASSDDRLTAIETMRLVYIAFLIAFFSILVVLPIINPDASGSLSVTTADVILVASAAVSCVTITIYRGRGAPVTTPDEAVGRYRTRMFVLIALAEPVAMIGFVLVFVTGSQAPYLVGLALTVPGLYIAAPNRASIERFQERFGGAVDVLAALTR